MQPLRTLIVEDNEEDLELLIDLLSQKEYADDIHIAAVARTFKEAVLLLTKECFELSILDFELDKNMDLDNLVDMVGTENMGIVALHTISTSGNHASAEKLGMDIYMGKPFSEIGMLEFIKKLRKIRSKTVSQTKISITEKGQIFLFNSDEILYIKGDKNYSTFYIKTEGILKTFRAQGSLGNIYLLLPDIFIRCHESYIINVTKVVKVDNEKRLFFDLEEYDPHENDLDKKKPFARYSSQYISELTQKGILKK